MKNRKSFIKIFSHITLISLLLFSSFSHSENNDAVSRTYIYARDGGVRKVCSSNNYYYGKMTVNIHCLEFDTREKWGRYTFEDIIEKDIKLALRRWNGFSSGNTEGNLLNPPHYGLVGIYDSVPPIKVRVQFLGLPDQPLTQKEAEPLFERLKNKLGLVAYKEYENIGLDFETALKKVSENDKRMEDEQRALMQIKADKKLAATIARKKEKEKIRPKCKSVYFTGYAAINSNHLAQVHHSDTPDELMAYNPIICTKKAWGGRLLRDGGIVNRNSMINCKGIGYFTHKIGTVIDWSSDILKIQTEVDFNTGRRPLDLYIVRKDAQCN